MLRWIGRGVLAIVALFVALFVMQLVASESGEVVVVSTFEDGQPSETRLWVVDYEGSAWLRSGSELAGWYQRMVKNPQVEVVRGSDSFVATVVPKVELRDAVNDRFNAKYGWADDFIGFLFGRDDAIPLQLQLNE